MKVLKYLLVVLLFGCEPDLKEPYETFVIPEGKHSSGIHIEQLQTRNLNFRVMFNETAQYTSAKKENQHDINKLIGFSDCNDQHHSNSARFGWRWLNDALEIHAYCYVQGQRVSEYVGTIEINQSYHFQLSFDDDAYHFFLEGHPTVTIDRHASCNRGIYYMLFPYFGGDEVAPHDISIKIRFGIL